MFIESKGTYIKTKESDNWDFINDMISSPNVSLYLDALPQSTIAPSKSDLSHFLTLSRAPSSRNDLKSLNIPPDFSTSKFL